MKSFLGKLRRDGQMLVDPVEGKLSVARGPRGEEIWSGFCALPGNLPLCLSDSLELVLDDNSSNMVRIERINTFGPMLTVSFLSCLEEKAKVHA